MKFWFYLYLVALILVALYIGYGCHVSIPSFSRMCADMGMNASPLASLVISFHSTIGRALALPVFLTVVTFACAASGTSKKLTAVLGTVLVLLYGGVVYFALIYPLLRKIG